MPHGCVARGVLRSASHYGSKYERHNLMYNSVHLTKIEHALAYAARGFSVFPCHTLENGLCSCGNAACRDVAKHPLTLNGVKDATTDVESLTVFFTGDYTIANVAVACGEPSGIWVIDVDDLADLDALEKLYGPLPKTPIAETGRGGRHYYFRWTPALSNLKNAIKFAGALDVRTTGGYVLLPPSIHASGNAYRWLVSPDESPIADAPEWLIALCPKRETLTVTDMTVDERVKRYLEACPPAVSGQGGHDHTYGIVCRLFEMFSELREQSDEAILTLLDSWNARCVPPWTDAELLHKLAGARAKASVPAATVKDNGNGSGDGEDGTADEWPTLHPDALYGFGGEVVQYLAPYSEADDVALLLTLHVGFGSCLGRNPYIRVGGDRHFPNLYACLVGSSSRARKGMSLGYILDLFSGVDPVWTGRRVNGLSSGEGVIHAVRDADVHLEDGKFAASGGVIDKRLFIVETEFGQTLKVLKRDGNTLSAVLRNGWDRGELHILTRREPLQASDAHISILGHITRDELHRFMDATDVWNGFANRFVWAMVKRSKLLPDGKTPPLDAWRKRLSAIVQKTKSIGEMKRSPSANELWREVYPALVADKRGLWDAATSRAEAQTLRLSMIFALLDGTSIIEVPHLRAALALWRYCDESARLIFDPDKGEGGSLEARIRFAVREHPGIMRTKLRDKISHKIKATELERALAWLAGRGEIERITSTENGRTCERLYPVDGRQGGGEPASASTLAAPAAPNALTPHRPDAPDTGEGAGGGDDRGTTALTAGEFVGGITQTTVGSETETTTATLAELIDWKNANGATFVSSANGVVWVTNEERLTPEVEAAIHANQNTLAAFVTVDVSGDRGREPYPQMTTPTPTKTARTHVEEMSEAEFFAGLATM